jgi:hypothetical protein
VDRLTWSSTDIILPLTKLALRRFREGSAGQYQNIRVIGPSYTHR